MEIDRHGAEQDSDYDGAWKEPVRNHLPEFLAAYFPEMHATIDWSTPAEWFDKELSQILGTAGSRNKRVVGRLFASGSTIEALLGFRALDDLRTWLDGNASRTP